MQYLPVASALIVGGLTLTTFTLQQGMLFVVLYITTELCCVILDLKLVGNFFSFGPVAGRNTQQFMASVLWAGVTAGVMAVVKANGRQFCSRPRLCGLL